MFPFIPPIPIPIPMPPPYIELPYMLLPPYMPVPPYIPLFPYIELPYMEFPIADVAPIPFCAILLIPGRRLLFNPLFSAVEELIVANAEF